MEPEQAFHGILGFLCKQNSTNAISAFPKQSLKDKRNRYTYQSCSKDNKRIGGEICFLYSSTESHIFTPLSLPVQYVSHQFHFKIDLTAIWRKVCCGVLLPREHIDSFVANSPGEIVTKSIIPFTACYNWGSDSMALNAINHVACCNKQRGIWLLTVPITCDWSFASLLPFI